MAKETAQNASTVVHAGVRGTVTSTMRLNVSLSLCAASKDQSEWGTVMAVTLQGKDKTLLKSYEFLSRLGLLPKVA